VDKAGRRFAVKRIRRVMRGCSAAPGASGRGGSLRVRSETRGMDAAGKRRTGKQARAGCGLKAALAATLPGPGQPRYRHWLPKPSGASQCLSIEYVRVPVLERFHAQIP
jgi:hypothetical protein